jgi:hypothetical protein
MSKSAMHSYQAPMTGGEKHISGMEVFRQQMFHKVFPPHALFLLKRSRGGDLLDGSPRPGSVNQAWGGTKCYSPACCSSALGCADVYAQSTRRSRALRWQLSSHAPPVLTHILRRR